MLGFYVHTHWGYSHPYAARTWTLEDWDSYLTGLRALGFDLLHVWPLLESMPPGLTASDRAFLDRSRQVIDLAKDRHGMHVMICLNVNTVANERAHEHDYERRPYFVCERKLNPAAPEALTLLDQHARETFAYLHRADSVSMIDSDPGGWIGSTNAEYVEMMRRRIECIREMNPAMELYYWMHVGWENYNAFWRGAEQLKGSDATPDQVNSLLRWDTGVFVETLELIQRHIPEPWGLLITHLNHIEATNRLGMQEKRLQQAYGVVEGEPTFPFTNWNPPYMDHHLNHYYPPAEPFPRGCMGNAQTHCMQLPHTYLFSEMAKGKSILEADLRGFAHDVLPGCGELVAKAWEQAEGKYPEIQRDLARRVRDWIGREFSAARCSGLLFGDANRFLEDLAIDLEVRADLTDFNRAVNEGCGEGEALAAVARSLRRWVSRLGFVDAYGGPLYDEFNVPLQRLDVAEINAVLVDFHTWGQPERRNGALARLLDAVDAHLQGA